MTWMTIKIAIPCHGMVLFNQKIKLYRNRTCVNIRCDLENLPKMQLTEYVQNKISNKLADINVNNKSTNTSYTKITNILTEASDNNLQKR